MPKFNLAPLSDDLNPVWPPVSPPKATRAQMNQSLENRLGPLKPLGQLMNTLASPDTKAGIFTGPINGISKLTNALGDLIHAGAFPIRPGLPEARDGGIDQPRVDPLQIIIGNTQPVLHLHAHILNQHIGIGGELHQRCLALR